MREQILRIAAKHGATHVRVFGSTVRREDSADSDIDFLIDCDEETSPWFPASLKVDLEDLLGRPVDIAIEKALYPPLRQFILREARPL